MRDALNRTDAHKQEMIVRNLVQRGVVDRVDASQKMQSLDISLGNGFKPTKVEHWERYGFTYHPKPGAEVLALAIGGNPDHMVVIDGADRRYRIKNMAEGELAIHDDQGQVVHFKRGGIHVESALGITLKGPITFEGDVTHTGNYNQTGVHIDSNGPHTA